MSGPEEAAVAWLRVVEGVPRRGEVTFSGISPGGESRQNWAAMWRYGAVGPVAKAVLSYGQPALSGCVPPLGKTTTRTSACYPPYAAGGSTSVTGSTKSPSSKIPVPSLSDSHADPARLAARDHAPPGVGRHR